MSTIPRRRLYKYSCLTVFHLGANTGGEIQIDPFQQNWKNGDQAIQLAHAIYLVVLPRFLDENRKYFLNDLSHPIDISMNTFSISIHRWDDN